MDFSQDQPGPRGTNLNPLTQLINTSQETENNQDLGFSVLHTLNSLELEPNPKKIYTFISSVKDLKTKDVATGVKLKSLVHLA